MAEVKLLKDTYELLTEEQINKFSQIVEIYLQRISCDIGHERIEDCIGSLLFLGECYSFLIDKNKWDKVIFQKWNQILLKSNILNCNKLSLFGGLADIAFTSDVMNQQTGHYAKLSNQLKDIIVASIPSYLSSLKTNYVDFAFSFYDCISGAAGILGYLLNRRDESVNSSVLLMLQYFVEICSHDMAGGNGWYVSNQNMPAAGGYEDYPNGAFNFSLSHGVAGVLCSLAIAFQRGITVPGHFEAMQYLCERFFLRFVKIDNEVPYWPGILPAEKRKEVDLFPVSRRMSWCYGSPSILRVLQIYATSTHDDELKSWTHVKLENIAKLTSVECQLVSPTICHGLAGLLTTLTVVNKEKPSRIISDRICGLFGEIMDAFNPQFEYGFENIDYIPGNTELIRKSSSTGSFLTGSSGIMLALLSVIKSNTTFERHLLLK